MKMIGTCWLLLPLADEARGLEAVHAGHVDVEQDDRELAVQDVPQRLAPGVGADDRRVRQVLEHRLERQELLGAVVDDQDAGLGVGHSQGCRMIRCQESEAGKRTAIPSPDPCIA